MSEPVFHLARGQSASLERTFTDADVHTFVALCGDDNPIHLDAGYAARTRFRRPIVHGALTNSLIGALIGTRLPGPGAILLSQRLHFVRPVFPGQRLTARVEVTRIRRDKPIVTLATEVRDENGEPVLMGEAVVLIEPPQPA